jgi:hypothetical protein
MKTLLLVGSLMMFGPIAMADNLPLPPIPPRISVVAAAAPVPNPNAEAPIAPESDEPSLSVRLYRAKSYDPSAGFVPGSRYQSNEDRKVIQTPGFSINVPLK